MKQLLLPMDGSRRSRHTIEITKLLFSPADTRVTILTVIPAIPTDTFRESYCAREAHQLQQEAGQILADLAGELPGYQVETVLRHGDPGTEIIRQAREKDYDAILMTRSSRGPLQRLGSVAAYVIKAAADQNVFVMHERD